MPHHTQLIWCSSGDLLKQAKPTTAKVFNGLDLRFGCKEYEWVLYVKPIEFQEFLKRQERTWG